jgi:hypothetical protein
MAFFSLGATQLAMAIGSRSRPGTRANPLLPVAVATALLLQFAGLYLPPLRDLLGTQELSISDIVIVCVLSTLGYAAIRLDRVVHPSKRPPAPPPSPMTCTGSASDVLLEFAGVGLWRAACGWLRLWLIPCVLATSRSSGWWVRPSRRHSRPT